MDPGPADDEYGDLTGSNWVALTATPQRMRQLTGGIRPRKDSYEDGAWVPLEARPGFTRWTDDYARSEEHTSELQSLMRNSYAVFCLKKKNNNEKKTHIN